ncbi:MAG: PilZ domain-containing protein [Desulfurivibrionaceae bacterium]
MSETKSFKERRKEPRFTMQAKTYAVLRQPANKIGKILDISRSGLAFTYLSTNETLTKPVCRIDLLAEDEGVLVENLPFSSVSDCVVPNKQPFQQITMRRHSIKFGNLDEDQVNALELFIKKYFLGYQENGKGV